MTKSRAKCFVVNTGEHLQNGHAQLAVGIRRANRESKELRSHELVTHGQVLSVWPGFCGGVNYLKGPSNSQ